MRRLSWVIVFVMIVHSAVFAAAHQSRPVEKNFKGNPMVLLGTALKKFLTFRVVTVDLYIGQGYQSKDILSDVPKRIEVNYHVNIPKQELDRATIKGVKQNYNDEQFLKLKPQIDQINSYYPDIKSGDQISVTYVPGQGSEVELNGEFKGVVPGGDFAQAFFAIWIGENPVDKQAKLKLLGQKNRETKGEEVE